MTVHRIIAVFWLIFLTLWFFSAFGAKKNASRSGRGIAIRIAIAVGVLLFFRARTTDSIDRQSLADSHPLLGYIGAALCALGIALAIWARVFLGKNWGMPMSVKVEPELVTSGPYAFARHPIYTGMLVAMCGSALASSVFLFVPVAIFAVYFIYSATREEKIMASAFPTQYPEYKKRTKMLIPFIF